jgi:branched-chain amino acid transport system substrate-binding protein
MVQAWFAYENAHGGVNCHPVKLYVLDDGGNPATNQALTQQAVEQDHVIAFVENGGALTQSASLAYITQQAIPIIGTAEMYSYNTPYYFPVGPVGINAFGSPGYAAASYTARGTNLKNVGVLTCSELAQCGQINAVGPAETQKYGLNLVYSARASLTATNYTAQCEAAKNAGVQILFPVFGQAGEQLLSKSCDGVNFHPKYVFVYSDVDDTFLTNPDFNGAYVTLPVLPWTNTTNSSIAQSISILSQYAPATKPDAATSIGWAATQLFALVTQNLPDPPTAQAVNTALWSVKNNDLGGVTVPLTFTQGQVAPNSTCLWLVQIKDGQFLSANGGQSICG